LDAFVATLGMDWHFSCIHGLGNETAILWRRNDTLFNGLISFFKALVLGEQGDIPEEIKEYFILTGTAHLLAISGDQFGIVALLSFSLFIWILKRSEFLLLSISVRKWAAGLTIPCIVLYAFIAGGGISVIRAMIMVVTFLFSILFNSVCTE
jgi:competence protein ComEC